MAFRSKWNGSQDPRMNRLIFSVVFLIRRTGAFIHFRFTVLTWGPHSVDRFANHVNAKLPPFNSRFWNPGSEGIDAFVMNWHGENNYVCPPICLILRVLHHMRNCKASDSLIVPLWHSAPF